MSVASGRSEVEALAAWVLDEARSEGADSVDVLYSEGESYAISLRDGEVEEYVSGKTAGIGVRTIMSDGRQGIAYGNRLDKLSLRDIVAWSISNCKNSEPEEGIFLYSGTLVSDPSIDLEDPSIAGLTPAARMDCCRRMTEKASSADPRVISVRGASWHDGWEASFYCTTTGLAGWERGSSAACGVTVLASDGVYTEIGGYGKESRLLSDLDLETCASLAASKTVSALGGSPMPTCCCSVLLEAEAASSLVDTIGGLFCASDVHKGRSMMKGRLGSLVASTLVTLTDDPRVPWKAGTASWDSEGVPTGRTVLIADGIANAYLYNLQHAYKDGVKSTGSAVRGMSSLPDVGTSNLILKPGSYTRDALVEYINYGLYVTDFMGLHTIDPVSGDFSIGAKGFLIENGRLTRPVSGVTIASNLMGFIKNIVAVGSDAEYFGAVSSPSLVVENVAIAGE